MRSDTIMTKTWIIAAAVVLFVAAFLFFRSPGPTTLPVASGIPDNYYFSLKSADVDSPIELIRFSSSIRPDTAKLTVAERAAYFEWYLKNRGFNVSFVSSKDFRNLGQVHTWLLVKNKLGETMFVEPSAQEMKAESICPTTPDYKNYQSQFKDIYELSSSIEGVEKYAWWRTSSGKELFQKSVMLLKKEQL
jgi:hypothetical protein